MRQVFIVLGEVRGQGRARATIRGKHAGVYKATVDRQYEDNIRAQVVAQKPTFLGLGVPVSLRLRFYSVRPKFHYNSKGEVKERFLQILPVGRPDLDNAIKGIKDSLNSIVWHDDCQVCAIDAKKVYGSTGRVEIIVEEIGWEA